MPIFSITTTIFPGVFSGDVNLESLSFRNGSSVGIIYLRNRTLNLAAVSSTSYDFSLGPGDVIGFTKVMDGEGVMTAAWDAISDTAAGVTLEILPTYKPGRIR